MVASRRLARFALLIALMAGRAPLALAAVPTALERNLAEQLFLDGKKLMEAGRYDEACPKLAESHRLDPGGGTILNLAVCHAAQGRYASAWSEFREAIDLARTDGRRDREEFALAELAKIEPKLSHLTLVVQDADAPGLVITLDGESIRRAAWGAPFPIDPGTHEIVASAPGRKDRRAIVRVGAEGDSKAVSIAALEPAPAPAAPSPGTPAAPLPTAAPAAPSVVIAETRDPGDEPSNTGRTVGVVIAGAGVIAIGAGAVAGVLALDKREQSDEFCSEDTCRTQRGIDLTNEARTLANYANVGIGVGVGALLVGTYLALTSGGPRAESPSTATTRRPSGRIEVSPALGVRSGSLRLSGTW